MTSQSRPFYIGGSNAGGHLNVDTTHTKIFVGGLAWETQRDTMTRYFEQFGEILEAVVITDKNTGRSKGYGFVTFKDQDSAMRACQNPSPVIDGRRANCNLASIGASNRTRPTTPQYGMGRMRSQATSAAVSGAYRGLSAASSISTGYFHQPSNYAFPYYGYSGGYPQETMYPVNYFGIGGSGQQHQHHFSPYYPANPGVYPNYYPYYVQYSQSAQAQSGGFGLHYPQMLQYPYLPHQFGSRSPILSLPVSVSAPTAGVTTGAVVVVSSSSQPVRTVPDQVVDIVSSTA